METRQGLPRLIQLFPKDNSKGNTTVDIIAVHGIETHSPRTWIAYEHDEEPRGRATSWLCDEDMLPKVVPQARIWAYDYNSNCYSDNAQEIDILGLGDSFLETLRGAQDKGIGDRLLVFIGSCFGGIVVAQALERAFRDRARYGRLLDSTAGVVFLGTPLRGTATASIAEWLVLIRGFMGKETSATLLDGLKEKDPSLNNVIHDFAERAIQKQLQIRCFYETRETHIAKAVASRWIAKFLPSVKLVSRESACLDGHKRIPLDATHPRMNKFRNPDDGSFKLVSRSLKELVDNASISQHRTKEESRCLESLTSKYQEDKNRNVQRVPGTCMWFLGHEKYLRWRQEPTASLLWVSADPGCGKSVLSRALVDEGLLKPNTGATSICYFFFKDDDPSRKDSANAMCAVLHQLFSQKPALLKYAMHEYQYHGAHLRTMFSVLWNILEQSAADPEAGEIVCVLDALDECREGAREELIQRLSCFYSSRKNPETKLKILATSRPYFDIERAFHSEIEDMTSISLRGEDESEKISKEIDLVISVRVPHICSARRPPLDPEVQQALISRLKEVKHRTYLWLYLILDVLRKSLESTKLQVERLVNRLPRTVGEAYEKMLRRIDEEQVQEARCLLHIVVAAVRPLTLGEMSIALAMNEKLEDGELCQSYDDLELQSEEAFREKVRNLCGLFIIVIDSRVYLMHQTAKEFLISAELNAKPAPLAEPNRYIWKQSLALAESNLIILKICLSYLLLHEIDDKPFLCYVAPNWAFHFQCARIKIDDSVMQSTLDVCEPRSYPFRAWWRINASDYGDFPGTPNWTSLMVASVIGLETVAKFLLEMEYIELNVQDDEDRTALHLAAHLGHSEVVKVLIEKDGVQLNLKDKSGQTPLHLAARVGQGVRLNITENGQTPLHLAARLGYSEVVKVLIEKNDVQLNLKDKMGRTPLHTAAQSGIYELIEEYDVQLNPDKNSQTPLDLAHKVVNMLLEKDSIDVNLRDNRGQTPLHLAAERRHLETAKLLLEKTSELDIKDTQCIFDTQDTLGETVLGHAVRYGRSGNVGLMLEKNARIDLVKIDGENAIAWAARHRWPEMVKLLVEKQGLEFDFRQGPDQPKYALFLWARRKGYT